MVGVVGHTFPAELVDNKGVPTAGSFTLRQDLLCGAIHVSEFSMEANWS